MSMENIPMSSLISDLNDVNIVNKENILSKSNYWVVIANPAYKSISNDLINIFDLKFLNM